MIAGIHFIFGHNNRHTPLGSNCNVKGVINLPPWPSSKKEEERDSWSLLRLIFSLSIYICYTFLFPYHLN